MSITIRKILHFFNKLRDIKKTFEKVTHFTPLHPTLPILLATLHLKLDFNDDSGSGSGSAFAFHRLLLASQIEFVPQSLLKATIDGA